MGDFNSSRNTTIKRSITPCRATPRHNSARAGAKPSQLLHRPTRPLQLVLLPMHQNASGCNIHTEFDFSPAHLNTHPIPTARRRETKPELFSGSPDQQNPLLTPMHEFARE